MKKFLAFLLALTLICALAACGTAANPGAGGSGTVEAGTLRVAALYDITTMAVDGVSLTIPRGGVAGLVGESGCGKSMARLRAGRPRENSSRMMVPASAPYFAPARAGEKEISR